MPVLPITVPGAKSVLNIITFNTDANTSFQNALLSSLQQRLMNTATASPSAVVTDPTAQPSAPAVLDLTTTPAAPAALAPNVVGVVDRAAGPVTMTGNQETNQSIIAGGAGLTFHAVQGESGTLAAATGTTVFTAPAQKGGDWTVLLDQTGGSNTVVAGSSHLYVQDSAGQKNLVFLGSSQDTAWIYGSDTVVGGPAGGAATVSFHGSQNVLVGNGGNLLVLDNSGANTVVGGSGADTFVANASGSQYFGGSGANTVMVEPSIGGVTYTATSGDSTIYAFAGSSGTYNVGTGNFVFVSNPGSNSTINGASNQNIAVVFGYGGSVTFNGNAVGNILVASADNTTLNASGSAGVDALLNELQTGNSTTMIGGSYYNLFIASPGNATMQGGAGYNLFQFFAGHGGGNNLITNWNSSDQIEIYGYSQNQVSESTVNGSTVITLSDGTRITVQSAIVPASQIHIG